MKKSALLVLVGLLACAPAPTAQPSGLTQLAVANSNQVSGELLSASPLVVGQNRVFYRLTKEGGVLAGTRLEQLPLLRSGPTQQSAPVQNPSSVNEEGLWEGLIIFTRPSSPLDEWNLVLNVENAGELDQLDFGALNVGDSPMKAVVTRGGQEILLTLGFSEPPHVGANEVVITAHQPSEATMMNYVTVNDLVFTVTPEMPSMGHGAAGSVNPTQGEDGFYRGTVVMSMSGEWVIHLVVAANDAELGRFDFRFDL